jgi:hypothetical protein
MPFGKRVTPPSGGGVEQLFEHAVVNGGRLRDFGKASPTRSAAEEAEQRAYLTLLIRAAEPGVVNQINALVQRRSDDAKRDCDARLAEVERAAAAKGFKVEIFPFPLIPSNIWLGKAWGLLGVGLSLALHDEWDILPVTVPNDPAGRALGIPSYPKEDAPHIVAGAERLMASLHARWNVVYEAAKRSGDVEALAKVVDELRDDIRSFAAEARQHYTR